MVLWILALLLPLTAASSALLSPPAPTTSQTYTNACFLGYGSYHAVVLAADDAAGKRHALKCYSPSTDPAHIQHEYDTHRHIVGNCPSVVQATALGEFTVHVAKNCGKPLPRHAEKAIRSMVSQQTFTATCMVMDLAHGSLLSPHRIGESEARTWFKQVFEALACLHDRGIVHGDIKPHNILLFQDVGGYAARLADFDMSYDVADPTLRITRVRGTKSYHAPELHSCAEHQRRLPPNQHHELKKVHMACFDRRPGDVYAVGLTMKQLIQIESSELLHLLGSMMADEPGERMDMGSAKQHAWFNL
jgi:serine/threonine protein kinase